MKPATHLAIDTRLCGRPVHLQPGEATVRFDTTPEMAVDDKGLVHGGFIFGLADHAAMLAVNDPHVVLGAASLRFTAPVRVGQTVEATARVTSEDRRKRDIRVEAVAAGQTVLTGTLTAFVLDGHVLDR